jgi:hypothetical protein
MAETVKAVPYEGSYYATDLDVSLSTAQAFLEALHRLSCRQGAA